MKFQQEEIEDRLGYRFKNTNLLKEAFTHSSILNESNEEGTRNNERLEFLGDRVLNLLITEYIYDHFQEEVEGVLSQRVAKLVEASSCIHYVEKLDVKQYLLMGKGEAQSSSSDQKFGDLFEAIIGAIYLDGGFESAKTFFFQHFAETVEELLREPFYDVKSILQSLCQKYFTQVPEYIVKREEGPDHQKTFYVEVLINEVSFGSGLGRSKKEAQVNAAKEALKTCKEKGYFENEG